MPAIILSDGVIGQMMEKVVLPPYRPRRTDEEIRKQCPWAANGLGLKSRKYNYISSLELDPQLMEKRNRDMSEKYRKIEETEVRYDGYMLDDADYVIVAFGSSARISMKAVDMLREEGIKAGILRPITLWPFPSAKLSETAYRCKAMLTVELNEGQMVNDVRLAVNGKVEVHHFGRSGGMVPAPSEIYEAMKAIVK